MKICINIVFLHGEKSTWNKYIKFKQNQLYLVMWREIPSCQLALSYTLKRNEHKKMTNEISRGSECPFGCQWVYPTWHLWALLYIVLQRRHGDSTLRCPPSKLCTPKALVHRRWALQRVRRSLEGRGQALKPLAFLSMPFSGHTPRAAQLHFWEAPTLTCVGEGTCHQRTSAERKDFFGLYFSPNVPSPWSVLG